MAENGFCEHGEQERMIHDGDTEIGGRFPVNTDGGCLANGEPIGASGLRQVYENVLQLRGDAGSARCRTSHGRRTPTCTARRASPASRSCPAERPSRRWPPSRCNACRPAGDRRRHPRVLPQRRPPRRGRGRGAVHRRLRRRLRAGTREPTHGVGALEERLARGLPRFAATSHHVSNIEITFDDDDTATGITYLYAWHRYPDDRPTRTVGPLSRPVRPHNGGGGSPSGC